MRIYLARKVLFFFRPLLTYLPPSNYHTSNRFKNNGAIMPLRAKSSSLFLATLLLASSAIATHCKKRTMRSPRKHTLNAQWEKKVLGGDTAYNPNLIKKSVIDCEREEKEYATFHSWKAACDLLPSFNSHHRNAYKTAVSASLMEAELDRFFKTMQKQIDQLVWLGGTPIVNGCVDFQAYAEKLVIPSSATVAIHGDMHGDIHAINRFITWCANHNYLNKNDPFKIKAKNFYILFLGDYVDRGWYGAEVMYTIMRLKNENPNHVFMVRGNHEEIGLNEHYGFAAEVAAKFAGKTILTKINRLYNLLPVVLYLGAGTRTMRNYIQCCHGGMEIGFDPTALLDDAQSHAGVTINHLLQEDFIKRKVCADLNRFKTSFCNKPISAMNGFMWNDFTTNPQVPLALSPRDGYQGSVLEFGKATTNCLLKTWSGKSYTIRSVFRAHQQGYPDMRARILNTDHLSHPADTGIGKLWIENSVHQKTPGLLDNVTAITFSVAPETGYGYPIHAFGLLKVAPTYADWRLETITADFIQKK